MSPKEVTEVTREALRKPSAPAWLSAASALIVCLVALWSHASAPYQKTLDDHEQRIRANETLRQELSAINAKLDMLMSERGYSD